MKNEKLQTEEIAKVSVLTEKYFLPNELGYPLKWMKLRLQIQDVKTEESFK